MSAERAVELLAERERGALSPEGRAELLSLLASDPAARKAVAASEAVDRLLSLRSAPPLRRRTLLGMTAMLASTVAAAAALIAVLQSPGEVERLIERLGSADLHEREDAQARLADLGAAAEPALRRAEGDADLERAARARRALREIAERRELSGWDERVRALPRTFAEVKVDYRVNGQSLAGGVFRTREEQGAIVLDDHLEAVDGAKKLSAVRQTSAPDRWLNLRRVAVEAGKDASTAYEARVQDGVLSSPGRSVNVSERLVSVFALFRVVGALPQRDGFVFEFDFVEMEGIPNLKLGHRLQAGPEEEIRIDGAALRARKWTHTGGGIRAQHYWVREHRVVRALIDGRKELIFSAK